MSGSENDGFTASPHGGSPAAASLSSEVEPSDGWKGSAHELIVLIEQMFADKHDGYVLSLGHWAQTAGDPFPVLYADMKLTVGELRNIISRHALPSAAVERPSRREDVIEECAKIADQAEQDYLSPEYATGQPMSSLAERIACRNVATQIRSLLNHAAASEGASPEAVIPTPKSPPPSEVEELVERLKDHAKASKRNGYHRIAEAQTLAASSLHSLSARVRELEEALRSVLDLDDLLESEGVETDLLDSTRARARTALHGSEDAE